LAGNNFATFGSTTTGLYGLAGNGIQNVATLFSINPQTGAVTAIGPVGVIGNGQFAYARLSVGSNTLYMENNGNLYTINTTTGAGTQVGELPTVTAVLPRCRSSKTALFTLALVPGLARSTLPLAR
jgi:hypothetical protein